MANLNLSEFTEKLFVADADHTFIWDTQNAISKRVSRNSWLNSGTLTSDAPVTISQTWNALGQTFKALVVNAAGTSGANSAIGSLLADFQEGGVSKVRVRKDGTIFVPGGSNSSQGLSTTANYMAFVTGLGSINQYGSTLYSTTGLLNLGAFSFNVGTITFDAAGKLDWGDAAIVKDSTNTLALRNGAAAQTFNVYGTSSASNANYARLALTCGLDGNATISTQALGTGTAGVLAFSPGNSERMRITSAGNVGIGTTAPSEKLHVLGGKVLFGDPSDPTGTAGNGELTLHARTLPQLNMVSNVGVNSFFGLSLKAGAAERAGLLVNMQSGEVKMGALSGSGYFPTFWSNGVEIMRLSTTGLVGIGTTSPTSKLQVSAGDVEVDTIAKGVILKSPDGTRYRVTVANGGTLSVAAV